MAFADTLPVTDDAPRVSDALPGDYLALLKPRVMSLVVFTALVGLVIAPGHLNPVLAGAALLAIAVGAGASGALNMWWDADIDAVMTRTRGRPIPMGRVSEGEALAFGLALSAGAVLALGVIANWLAAGLLAFTIFFYAVIYSMWLKRATPQNIVIGGAAGALPPVVGYAAVTGDVALAPLVLFAIIFVWTPPHFWALALLKQGDYGRAGIPMLPNIAGAASTRRHILAYSFILAPLGVAPALLGFAGAAYAAASLAAGAVFLYFAVELARAGDEAAQRAGAGRLFGFSILYLFALFATILAEHGGAWAMARFG